MTNTIRLVLLAALTALAAGCGGGGGDGGGGDGGGEGAGGSGGGSGGSGAADPGASEVTVSGKITYDRVPHLPNSGLDYANTTAEPVRGATVQLVDSGSGLIVAAGVTDGAGDYSLSVDAGSRVRVRVRAETRSTGPASWDVIVVDNTASDAVYVLESSNFETGTGGATRNLHAPSGWGGSSYTGTRSAAPFAILDSVYDAILKVLEVDAGVDMPELTVHWSEDNRPVQGDESAGEITTSFFRRTSSLQREIFLLGAADVDTDEYDTHIVIHEWGHYFEDALSRSDSIGGAHAIGDRLDPRVAFSEGFGYAFAGMVTDDPVTHDSLGTRQQGGFSIDVEANGNFNPGWYSEGSVQTILYDFYDTAADGVDAIELGFAPLYDLFVGDHASSTTLTTIFSFVTALKQANPASASAIDAIVAGQDIVAVTMDAHGSTETNDANRGADVLPVYATLQTAARAVEVCSLGGTGFGDFGTYNKLSNRRFLRVSVAASGAFRFTAVGPAGSDPDLILHQRGILEIAQLDSDRDQTLERTLAAGDYVLEVYEYSNTTDFPRGRTCFDVTMEQI